MLLLGCPSGRAKRTRALLADALGYGYLDMRYSVPMSLDLGTGRPRRHRGPDPVRPDADRRRAATRRRV